MPAQRLTDVAGIAEYLGMTEKAVRAMVSREQIPVVRIGRSVKFDLRRIDRWIEAHSENPKVVPARITETLAKAAARRSTAR